MPKTIKFTIVPLEDGMDIGKTLRELKTPYAFFTDYGIVAVGSYSLVVLSSEEDSGMVMALHEVLHQITQICIDPKDTSEVDDYVQAIDLTMAQDLEGYPNKEKKSKINWN